MYQLVATVYRVLVSRRIGSALSLNGKVAKIVDHQCFIDVKAWANDQRLWVLGNFTLDLGISEKKKVVHLSQTCFKKCEYEPRKITMVQLI